MNISNRNLFKDQRILPATFTFWLKEIQEEGRWISLFDLDLKLLQILPRRIMHVPLPDNIYLNMLTCWKQEMRSVLELCCKMIQSQEKQGSSARTPVKTLSPFWAERIHGIDGSYKTQHIRSRVEPPSSHILGIQVLPVTRGFWSNWQLLFSTYSTANQKNKAPENCLSQQTDLI